MKSIKKLLFVGLFVAIVLPSCTIEKRVYMSGHNIEWLNGKHSPNKQTARTGTKKLEKSKSVVAAQTESVTNTENNYSNQTGTENDIYASADNSSIVVVPNKPILTPKTVTPVKDISTAEAKVILKQAVKKSKSEKVDSTSDDGGKSWIGALLLCIFLGGLGIHRFYLGYIWQGVVQLLTAGGCGIWALIDLIRIIIRDLKPKNGDYKD